MNDEDTMARNDRDNHIYNHGPYRSDDADYSRDFAQRAGGGGREWGGGAAGGYGRSGEYGHEGGQGDFGGADAGEQPGTERVDHSGRGPKGFRTDERIHSDVCEVLARHGDIDASDVEVQVENGEVTLSGTVADRRTKRLAEDVVAQCRGVADVHNRLKASRRSNEDQSRSQQQEADRADPRFADRAVQRAVERDGDKADRTPRSHADDSVTRNEAIGTNLADTPPRSTALKEGTSQNTR